MSKNNTPSREHGADGHDFRVVGVDVSKKHLDAHELPGGRSARFPNTREGIRELGAWVGPGARWVVYESTGSHHLAMERALAARLPLSRVNPSHAKHFAKALGTGAKTDRADARVLAKMGRALPEDLRRVPPPSPTRSALDDPRAARDALTRDVQRLKGQMEHARNPLVCRQLKARLAMVKRHTQAVDRELNRLVARDGELSHRVELLKTMPGVADVTSVGLAVDVPELGTLSVRTAGSLAGLAPVANDSGSRRGKRRIQGGRASVRTLLYMSAMNAVQNNPVMRERHGAQGVAHRRDAQADRDGQRHHPRRHALEPGACAEGARGLAGAPRPAPPHGTPPEHGAGWSLRTGLHFTPGGLSAASSPPPETPHQPTNGAFKYRLIHAL